MSGSKAGKPFFSEEKKKRLGTFQCGVDTATSHAVLSLVERRPEGARVRSFYVSGTARADLMLIIEVHVSPATHVITDEAVQYANATRDSDPSE